MKLKSFAILFLLGAGSCLAQETRVIHSVNTTDAPLLRIGSMATKRLVEGSDKPGEMGVLFFSKDTAAEPKRKYVGHFGADGALSEGVMYFKNGDRYDGEYSNNEYSAGEYQSKAGGWTYKGLFSGEGISGLGVVISFSNGDKYEGAASATYHTYQGAYRFIDGEVLAGYWRDNLPTSGGIVLAGHDDTVKGAFMQSGTTTAFKSSDGKLTRTYTIEENLETARKRSVETIASAKPATSALNTRITPASDFCGSLQQAMKAAESGAQGLKSLATEIAKTGTYIRDYSNDGSVLNSSVQLIGALQTAISGIGGAYYMYAAVEDIPYEYALRGKYEGWKKKVSDCITGLGRPVTAYKNGEANMYYESGDAVVAVRFIRNWAGTTRSIVYIEVNNTAAAFHTYRTAAEAPVAGGGGGRRASVYATYVFISDCSDSRQRNFKTLCKVDADLSKHTWEEVQAKASGLLNGSDRSCGTMKYLGKGEDVKISGTPGRDYAVTGGTIMDF